MKMNQLRETLNKLENCDDYFIKCNYNPNNSYTVAIDHSKKMILVNSYPEGWTEEK